MFILKRNIYEKVGSMTSESDAFVQAIKAMIFAGVVSYILFYGISPQGKRVAPIDTGKRWLAWTVVAVSMAALPKFFRDLEIDSLLRWAIGAAFYGSVAFIIGRGYTKLFRAKQYDSGEVEPDQVECAKGEANEVNQQINIGLADLYEKDSRRRANNWAWLITAIIFACFTLSFNSSEGIGTSMLLATFLGLVTWPVTYFVAYSLKKR